MLREFREQRIKEIEQLKRKNINPYPNRFDKTHTSEMIKKEFEGLNPGEVKDDVFVSTAGRIMSLRKHGKSAFFHIKDFYGRIQAYIRKDVVGEEAYEFFKEHIAIGDIVGVKGNVFKSKTGEITILIKEIKLLNKPLRPMPEKWHGIKDKEVLYRQRYVDMIANDDTLNRFKVRFEVIKLIRDFLNSKGFIEVETPILEYVTGGASARPFVTHLNVFDIEMYMRIATELYLKRFIVGGFEKVYELGKNFRNEGLSYKHHPEFTSIEIYQAYADYEDMMNLTEELFVYIVEKLFGTTKIKYQNVELDFSRPWRRIKMRDFIKEHLGVDILEDSMGRMMDVLEEHGVEVEIRDKGHMIEKLWDLVEDKVVQPTFLLEHPVEISPLAKKHREDPRVTERFELIIYGREMANAFSELNDPVDQYERFLKQVELREAGDEEAQMMDRDFVRALEYGMPPTGGLGIGIDRLVMLLTNSATIRDVIAFPLVRLKSFEEEELDIEGGSQE
ncbi:lysyl-tRNA synthetase [Thermosipho melanesiensis]|uniref:Lysine--tRNA ligase n=2 Tax=Thermosipho melanesiensis TaxID=46541 RepID=SYK_THEM4|nr:lysine--tRNA ligase [Thermosipho melanesiensis]A6LMS4.1 RecName: Full=Lysine--tRNA ligase; AltName: Full=Lysyl-tRNA synthetase; Short=LysRS [Thermosipho melanesiensis BI429]ABR31225.1 lysyl-tRNA synthetase [Thermosipho melanesiensis BI429]APT74309.1 lysyl-tRNA synthetase [Thermosipho melanesiensis]OOC36250.1 lysyl-tRNA synthetase [Thermosipho melanesiensis]OOC37068.1 lysyl-tRNA synthetase [Thermosipho melanesiensis]OOC37820.1 lysyl-tRNA synthetase [Thermosipho melanesiensis]